MVEFEEDPIASGAAPGATVIMAANDPDHPGRLNGESIFLEGEKKGLFHESRAM